MLKEEPDAMRRDRTYLWMEPLRRCGIVFPEGASIILVPSSAELRVVHKESAMKQIESYMGLTRVK